MLWHVDGRHVLHQGFNTWCTKFIASQHDQHGWTNHCTKLAYTQHTHSKHTARAWFLFHHIVLEYSQRIMVDARSQYASVLTNTAALKYCMSAYQLNNSFLVHWPLIRQLSYKSLDLYLIPSWLNFSNFLFRLEGELVVFSCDHHENILEIHTYTFPGRALKV